MFRFSFILNSLGEKYQKNCFYLSVDNVNRFISDWKNRLGILLGIYIFAIIREREDKHNNRLKSTRLKVIIEFIRF